MSLEPMILIYIGSGLAFGAYTMRVADAKGYNRIMWFFGGFLFNIIALVAVAGLPLERDVATREREQHETISQYIARVDAERALQQTQQNR